MAVVALLACSASAGVKQGDISFVVIGDIPEGRPKEPPWRVDFQQLIQTIAKLQPPPAFVVHVGDIVPNNQPCKHEDLTDVFAVLSTLSNPLKSSVPKVPWVYVPGDNEWIDCGHAAKHEPPTPTKDYYEDIYFPLEDVRDVFFRAPGSHDHEPNPTTHQEKPGDYPENQRWTLEGLPGLVFITVNLVSLGRTATATEEVEFVQRGRADQVWLREAEKSLPDAKGTIVIFAQAEIPGEVWGGGVILIRINRVRRARRMAHQGLAVTMVSSVS
ncbi:MAG: metallophosphoesterase [Deltaproteobacteria bacterium]|nr:metallophosphoesterase [Deltaproteobacteria bacterium]MBI3387024.1 metallophosphoesterase [Deltaproteobacteria bacterium]